MSMMDLLTVVNGNIGETLDKAIYKSIVYTTINDLRTYGDTSCFYESMSADDRAKLYALESFVNSETVRDTIIKQALLDNRQLDMSESLLKSSMIKYLSAGANIKYSTDNGLLGRLLNLCAKLENSDLFVTDENYTVSDLLNDDSTLTTLFSYFTPKDKNNLFSIICESILKQNTSSVYSKLADLGVITVVTSSSVNYNATTTCSHDGHGYLLGAKFDWSGGSNTMNLRWKNSLTVDGTNTSIATYIGTEFTSNVTLSIQCTGYAGTNPTYYGTMYILPKNN